MTASLAGISKSPEFRALLQVAVRGTPDQVLRAYEDRRALLGDFELASSFRFGGIPYAKAEASMRLFAAEVLPVLKTWKPAVPTAEHAVGTGWG
jgi:hypothetical protein